MDEVSTTQMFSISKDDGQLNRCDYIEYTFHAPMGVAGATGALLRQASIPSVYFAVICGGHINDRADLYKRCHTLGKHLDQGVHLEGGRSGAAGVVTKDGTKLWVTGGRTDSQMTSSTVSLNLGSNIENNGTSLPGPMENHCVQMLQGNIVILYGGSDGDEIVRKTWIMDMHKPNKYWTHVASMNLARQHHACGILKSNDEDDKEVVVAAGGSRTVELVTDSVELFWFDSGTTEGKWEFGPKLPFKLFRAASATTQDQSKMFVVGGIRSLHPYDMSTLVLDLKCVGTTCQWRKNDLELLFGRDEAVAMILPPFSKMYELYVLPNNATGT